MTNDLIEGILANGLYQTIKEIKEMGQGVDGDIADYLWKKYLQKKLKLQKTYIINT